ncbi:hypothetical protein BST81_18460 [Leptolyngbya sp. 'hensonii']|uniref:hypothetical protein n=1 Tax=Leptolyngbya sp. 'hensonii' TaxID=1922337 RepID=UPI00094FD8FB|nr:hypothetical protein [Leptolyngbya sp. 'hensonii']OLP16966.1 hypothetical protein BST81_18460 [Leptolyngbya sp. 'hensonii']
MSYKDFTLEQIEQIFGLVIHGNIDLFGERHPTLVLNSVFKSYLAYSTKLALSINTEKARSEMIIAPILVELKRLTDDQVSLFSGVEFNVDPAKGLNGFCDFVISRSTQQFYIQAPATIIVEAKNENIKGGLAQCFAAMIAANQFNQAKGNAIDAIYGAVTTGNQWKFLKLVDNAAYIDTADYYIDHLERIMDILLSMVHVQPLAMSI